MTHIRQKLAFSGIGHLGLASLTIAVSQFSRHLIEGFRQLAEFVSCTDGNFLSKVPFTDLLRCTVELAKPLRESPTKSYGEQKSGTFDYQDSRKQRKHKHGLQPT